MQPYPHTYRVSGSAEEAGQLTMASPNLPSLTLAAPAEYGGPGDLWSPETLLVSAVASCFILTFKAIARASNLTWQSLQCDVEGTLEKSDKTTRFTKFAIKASLSLGPSREEIAEKLLRKAESACLITNSLNAEIHLDIQLNQNTE